MKLHKLGVGPGQAPDRAGQRAASEAISANQPMTLGGGLSPEYS